MRVLVCGGRDYADMDRMDTALNALHAETPISLLIHGAARGADSMAADWAEYEGIPTKAFPADWEKHGRSAGHIRNKQMRDVGRPEVVVAFPGGKGTASMIELAQEKNIRIIRP